MNGTRILASSSLLIAATLVCAIPASPQVSVGGESGSTIGRTFFRGAGGSGVQRSGPDRWGVPRLESLRGDHRQERRRSTVPINVGSLANGTANTPVPPRPRTRRPRLPRALPMSIVQVNNQITVVNASAPAAEENRAVRNVDVARARAASRPEPEPPTGTQRPTPEGASPDEIADGRTRVSPVPLVSPLLAPPSEEELDPRDCVTLRITTPGGIEWRHEVSLDALGASSVSGAASLLQGRLQRGEPLVVQNPGGGFSVPAAQVESLIVGPCR